MARKIGKTTVIEVGDLVEAKSWKGSRYLPQGKGIVSKVKAWYLLRDMVEVKSCLIDKKDIKIIAKQVVEKKYHKYL